MNATRRRWGIQVSALPVMLMLLMAASGDAGAQEQPDSVLVQGRVTDRQGQPVAGAQARVLGSDAAVRSGSDGRYRLRVGAGHEIRLRVSAPGFEAREVEATPQAGGASVHVILERAAFDLPAITVTGSTRAEIAAVPGARTVVAAASMQDRAPLSSMDALRTVPGIVTADEDPLGLNLNIGFRGLPPRRSSRTLLLEDGVPILLGPYGDPSMHYAPPLEALDRIEVIKGSGQIMNGPQTVGGVVNFVTRRPPGDGTYGALTLGGGTLAHRNGQVWAGTGRNGYGASVDWAFREGDGVRLEQGHRFHNVATNVFLPVGDRQSLVLKASLWDEASRISETGLTQEEFEAHPYSLPFTEHGRFDVRRTLGQAVHEVRFGAGRLQTNAYLSYTERASWRQSGESEERLGEDDYAEDFGCAEGATSYAECGNQGRPRTYRVAGVEPRLTLRLGGPAAAEFDVGGRVLREDVRRRQFLGHTPTSREDDATLTRDNEIATDARAAFVHARLHVGAFSVSPGLRVERVAQDIRNRFPGREAQAHQRYTQWLPGVGATWQHGGGGTLFAGVHRGFAPPRPADLYSPEPGQPLALVDPETSWNWEVGVRLDPRAGVGAEVTLFRMDFRNQIVEAPATAGQRFVNGGRTVHQGVELGGNVSLGTLLQRRDDVTFGAAWTWLPVARFGAADGRSEDVAGNRLPYAPRHAGSVSTSFAHRSGLTVGASAEHTGAQFADDRNTTQASDDGQSGVLPAYTVVNAFTSYAVPGTRIQVRAGVRNVFDRVYITQRNEGIYTGMRRILRSEVRWAF